VKPIEWREQSRGFWRSDCGRFDVMPDASRPGEFIAFDWERGTKHKGFTRSSLAKIWCQQQANSATDLARGR
jgi:hypothetical protein